MNLGEIMTTNVVTVSMDDILLNVKEAFDESGFHHLLVVDDEDEKKIVGVICDRDMLNHISPFIGKTFMERGQDLNTLKTKAHQIMTRNPVTAGVDTSVASAADMLLQHRLSCLPVVDENDQLCGIVTWRDLLPHCFSCSRPEQNAA